MPFDDDLKFSELANALAEAFYHEYFQQFGDLIQIERFPKENDKHILDREFAIDVRIHCSSGVVFTLQEKFRRPKYQHYQDITIEYLQNRHTGEEGDFFRLAVDYYAYGYVDHPKQPTKFLEFYILDYCRLKQSLAQEIIPYIIERSSSNANMMIVSLNDIPREIVVFAYPILEAQSEPVKEYTPLEDFI